MTTDKVEDWIEFRLGRFGYTYPDEDSLWDKLDEILVTDYSPQLEGFLKDKPTWKGRQTTFDRWIRNALTENESFISETVGRIETATSVSDVDRILTSIEPARSQYSDNTFDIIINEANARRNELKITIPPPIEKPAIPFEPIPRLMAVYDMTEAEVIDAIRNKEITKKVLKASGLSDDEIASIRA